MDSITRGTVSSAPIRILAMDDEPAVLEALKSLFFPVPDAVYLGGTQNAADLFRLIEMGQPDVVLLDTSHSPPTPEIVRNIQERWPHVRPVLYSASLTSQRIDDAVQAGVWGCITKLTPTHEVVRMIRQVHAGEFAWCPEARTLLDFKSHIPPEDVAHA